MELLIAPWPELANPLHLHFPAGARDECPLSMPGAEVQHSLSERNKLYQSC